MTLCNLILQPFIIFIRIFVRTFVEIVRTVCGWVTSTITTIKEVTERVCRWLPWPINKLCDLVTKLIEVIETITKWVCEEIIERVLRWIEIVLEYIIYIARWICWVIDWIIYRWWAYLLCKVGLKHKKYLRICVKILNDRETGAVAITLPDLNVMIEDAASIFDECNIDLIVEDIRFIGLPQYLTTTSCGFGSTFSGFWQMFSRLACRNFSISPIVTVYMVESMTDAGGCAFPGTDWVIVANGSNGGDGTVIVQEIAHLCDLWGHSSDPNNVMADVGGGTHDQITKHQCCMIRTSKYVTLTPPFSVLGISRSVGTSIMGKSDLIRVPRDFKHKK